MGLRDRVKNAWSAFTGRDPTPKLMYGYFSDSTNPGRKGFSRGVEKSIVTSVYNKIAIDAASIDIKHVQLDADGRYMETCDSTLNECLNIEANLDQTGRLFRQDIIQSMLDEGVIAIVPTFTNVNPNKNDTFKIYALRTAKIVQWYPKHVKVLVYDEDEGRHKEIVMAKSAVAIVENPMYAVMNEPNSTLQRLIRKLNLLDVVDEQTSSGKLDIIIQLPYSIKSQSRKEMAEQRRQDIIDQLTGSRYGIAYTDGTEHITQLNRPAESNLMSQIEYLTNLLYSQLGITTDILDGTADEKAMTNYYTRTIEPILAAITDEMERKFLTPTARTRGQTIMFFRDPFKLVPITSWPDIADKFTRNEILSSNEIRQIIGFKPSSQPEADVLRNKNMPVQDEDIDTNEATDEEIAELDSQISELEAMMQHSFDSKLAHYGVKGMKWGETNTSDDILGLRQQRIAEKEAEKQKKEAEAQSASSSSGEAEAKKEEPTSSGVSVDSVQRQIDALRRRLGRMSKEARFLMEDEIYAQIDSLKEQAASLKKRR